MFDIIFLCVIFFFVASYIYFEFYHYCLFVFVVFFLNCFIFSAAGVNFFCCFFSHYFVLFF